MVRGRRARSAALPGRPRPGRAPGPDGTNQARSGAGAGQGRAASAAAREPPPAGPAAPRGVPPVMPPLVSGPGCAEWGPGCPQHREPCPGLGRAPAREMPLSSPGAARGTGAVPGGIGQGWAAGVHSGRRSKDPESPMSKGHQRGRERPLQQLRDPRPASQPSAKGSDFCSPIPLEHRQHREKLQAVVLINRLLCCEYFAGHICRKVHLNAKPTGCLSQNAGKIDTRKTKKAWSSGNENVLAAKQDY